LINTEKKFKRVSSVASQRRSRKMSSEASSGFPIELILAVFRETWDADDKKAGAFDAREFDPSAKPEALQACAELVEAFVREATARACALAKLEDERAVDGSHLERVLPQLLLDFAG